MRTYVHGLQAAHGSFRRKHQTHPSALTHGSTIARYTYAKERRGVGNSTFRGVHLKAARLQLQLCKSDSRPNSTRIISTSTYSILSSQTTRFVNIFYLFFFLHSLCLCFLIPTCKSLRVIECVEFVQLLLFLRNDIKSLIPRRTKLRELVIKAWSQHFQALRRDLGVRLPHLLTSSSPLLLFYLGLYGAGLLYVGYMVRQTSPILYGSNCPLGCRSQRILGPTVQVGSHCVPPSSSEPHRQVDGKDGHVSS